MVQLITTADCVVKKKYWTLLIKKYFLSCSTVHLLQLTEVQIEEYLMFYGWRKRNCGKVEQERQLLRKEYVSNLIFQVLQRFTKHMGQYIFNVKNIELPPTM